MGAAMLVGGLKRERQRFDQTAANAEALMPLLAGVALVMPAILELVEGVGLPSRTDRAIDDPRDVDRLSVAVCIVLLATYLGGLLFSRSSATRRSTGSRSPSRPATRCTSPNVAIRSSAQIALLVAPVLVVLSFLVGPFAMPLVFDGFEVAATLLAILVANLYFV